MSGWMDRIDGLFAYLYPFWVGALGSMQVAAWLVAIIFIVELCLPGERLHWKTVLFNALYIPVFLTLAMALAYPVSEWVDDLLPDNILHARLTGRVTLPALAWFAVYLVVFDFLYYWFHRAQHSFGILWRYHMFHHSDSNVSMSTSARHHWLEEFLRYFFIAAPVAVLFGEPENIPLWVKASVGLYGLVIHWNTSLRLGFLSRWIVTPWYHRIHHSIHERHFGKNFAVIFPFWDWVFNTRYLPTAGEYPPTGIASLASRVGMRLLLPWPLPAYKPTPAPAESMPAKAS